MILVITSEFTVSQTITHDSELNLTISIRSLETGKYISAETTVDVNGFETVSPITLLLLLS